MISHGTPRTNFVLYGTIVAASLPIIVTAVVAPSILKAITPETVTEEILFLIVCGIYILATTSIVVFLSPYYEKLHNNVVARRLITGDIYEIMEISDTEEHERSGMFGHWTSILVTLKNTNTGKTKDIKCYPEALQERSVGERIGIVIRSATHTYEMDKYYLIPEQEFNVENERKKYRDDIPVYNDDHELITDDTIG